MITVSSLNQAPQISSFTADPERGEAPLSVTFTCQASDTDGSILAYKWDFNGDGEYDRTTTTGKTTYVYQSAGIYNATCTVVDNDGGNATNSTQVVIMSGQAPQISSFEAVPRRGKSPLPVSFTCKAYDFDGSIIAYKWDFDGDGKFDEITTDGKVTHVYQNEGESTVTYNATCTAVDDDENEVTSLPIRITVSVSNQPPQITSFKADFTQGEAPLPVTFTCEAHDYDGSISYYKWDFNGDGEIDRITTSFQTTYTYETAGTYSASCTVVDNEGAQTTSQKITIAVSTSSNAQTGKGCTIDPSAPFALDLNMIFGVPLIYFFSRYFRRRRR